MIETGLFYSRKKKKLSVPLKNVSYEIRMAGICSEISMNQTFVNTSQSSVEAVYVFPKDESSVLTQFSFETEGRRFKTSVAEKDEAFKKYDDAIKKGNGAALLDEVTRDLVQISIGNLKPGQKIVFTIVWAQELQIVDGAFRLFFPLTRFPRYQRVDGDPLQADIQNAGMAESIPYSMDLTVAWENSLIKNLSSKTHSKWSSPKASESNPNFTAMSMKGGTAGFTRDLELIGEPVSKTANSAWLAQHDNKSVILYSRFIPELESWPVSKNKEIVFLLDCSGSMEGDPINHARKALELCLRSISDGDTFSFVLFGSQYKIIRDKENKPFEYNDKNFEHAIKLISTFDASMGGTELYHAIKDVLGNCTGTSQEWVLLTDGGVSDPEKVIQLVAKAENKPRVFTFGIGHGASSSLLKGIARVSGGSCEMISDENSIGESVLRNFARIDQPRFSDIRLDTSDQEYDIAEPFNPVFEGDSWNTLALLKPSKTLPKIITLNATVDGKKISWKAPVIDLGKWNTPGCLWASKKIRHLEDYMPESGSNQEERKIKAQKSEALKIALDFKILSSQTSLVGIEERKEGEKWLEKPEYTIVPSLIAGDRIMECWEEPMFFLKTRSKSSSPRVYVSNGSVLALYEDDMVMPAFLRKQMVVSESPCAALPCPGSHARTARKIKKAKPEQPWYLQLVEGMSRNGLFSCVDAIKLLDIRFSNIKELFQTLCKDSVNPVSDDIIATLIAVKALESDEKVKSVCAKAIKKARAALVREGIDMSVLDGISLKAGPLPLFTL